MAIQNHDNLIKELSILGKDANLSITQRQRIRDRLFKKMGQANLIDAVQTHTEVGDLVMSLQQLQRLFTPKRIVLGIPATVGIVMAVFLVTFTTGAMARTAQPGDPLFGVKKAFEAVEVALTTDPAQRAAVQLSIVNDRIHALENADSSQVPALLAESQKAIDSAQTSLSSLSPDNDLNTKLKTLIESQKNILSGIATGNVNGDEVKKTILAMRDQLDKLIQPLTSQPTTANTAAGEATVATPTNGFVTLAGTIGSYTAKPTLMVSGKRYYLAGSTIDLISYMGSDRAVVSGYLNGDTITLTELTINGRLIWEQPTLDNNPVDNNLPGVEGGQN